MKLLKSLSLTVLAAICAFGLSASAQTSTWTIDKAHSGVQFSIRHLGVSNVHGSFSNVTGTVVYNEKDVTKSSVEAVIDTTTVNTSNDARDKHLKGADFFDVTKNPTMTFKSTRITSANGKIQMTGDLTLNGVTKSVTLDVDGPAPPQKGMGGKIVSGFSAAGIVKRSDFGFGSKFSAPALGDEVKFTIDIEIAKQ